MKNTFLFILFLFISVLVFRKCSFHPLPKERIPIFKLDNTESYSDGEYQLMIKNPVACPMRFFLSSEDESVNKRLLEQSPILLSASADTLLKIKDKGDLTGKINIKIKFGNPDLPIRSTVLKNLPFPAGKRYKLLQGNNSNPTHNSYLSRYAFDFTMSIGDTITAAQNGYVVGLVDGYTGWGMGNKWKPFGNQLIIYDKESRLFTQYGHLKQNGGLVELGDFVKIAQPIALSGKTGQTTEEHLHFNVWQAEGGKSGLKSYPLDSIGNYNVKGLERYQWMEN